MNNGLDKDCSKNIKCANTTKNPRLVFKGYENDSKKNLAVRNFQENLDISHNFFGIESDDYFGLHVGDVYATAVIAQVGNKVYASNKKPLLLKIYKRDDNCVFREFQNIEQKLPMKDTPYYRFYIYELEPDSEYNYYVINLEDNKRSKLGRFKTLPNYDSKTKCRLAFSNCYGYVNNNKTRTGHLNNLLIEKPDLHLILGDFVYQDLHIPISKISPVRPNLKRGTLDLPYRPSLTLNEINKLWEDEVWGVDNIANGCRSSTILSIGDDHEYINNWTTTYIRPKLSEDAMTLYNFWKLLPLDTKRRDVAEVWAEEDLPDNYFENFEKSYSDNVIRVNNNGKRYFYKQFGEIDIIVLDDVFDRENGPDGLKIISEEQMKWFKSVLKMRKKSIKLVISSKPFDPLIGNLKNTFNSYYKFFSLLRDTLFMEKGIQVPDSAVIELSSFRYAKEFGEYWYYYSNVNSQPIPLLEPTVPQTDEILDFIRSENINGVLFIGGDYHTGGLIYGDTINDNELLLIVNAAGSGHDFGLKRRIPTNKTILFEAGDVGHMMMDYDPETRSLKFRSIGNEGELGSFELYFDENFKLKEIPENYKIDCNN